MGSVGPGTKQLGTKEQRNRGEGIENRAQKMSKNLVLYWLGPIGSNPIGGGKSTIELFGFMRSAPGEVQRMQPPRRQSCPKKY